jgi:predicted glycogen debranching enzyme
MPPHFEGDDMVTAMERREWLEPDGLGGFASGTASGLRTRRYHALLLSAASPPTGRQVLVAGLDAAATLDGGTVPLSSQRYAPDVVHPDGMARLVVFNNDPWPSWTYRVGDAAVIEQSLFVPRGLPVVVLRWRVVAATGLEVGLTVRPFLAGRDYHGMQHQNGACRLDPRFATPFMYWELYDGVQPILAASTGRYRHQPDWYRNFQYDEERARGLDFTEDLACPGTFEYDVLPSETDGSQGRDAVLVFAARTPQTIALFSSGTAAGIAQALEETERTRRTGLGAPLRRAADAYIVRRGTGRTVIAGYPWFTDWGRDTFISLRGLCIADRRLAEARDILVAWAGAVSEGMLPNRFADAGETPEFNAVDASLWFVIAAHELLAADDAVPPSDGDSIRAAIEAILRGYRDGTRYGIRADADGLLAAGAPGAQLTWMDARVGDRVITPRIGKPVEVQALWINALWAASQFNDSWRAAFERARASFLSRFWNESAGALFDVVDVDHVPGKVDPAFRPNQIFAAGGLPLAILDGTRARQVVDAVEARLWTPAGLRSLAPDDPRYAGRYSGGVESRDGAYHQGTAWPWLIGPFVDAWVRTRGGTAAARSEARTRFREPVLAHLDPAGAGHLPEVADGDAPHQPGGCPFQAWSLGEVIRLQRSVLAPADTGKPSRHQKAARTR